MQFSSIPTNAHYPLRHLFLVSLATMTVAIVFSLILAQQALRLSANETITQLSEDTSGALEAGTAATLLASPTPVRIDKSLAPYVIITNTDGAVVASSGQLNGTSPVPSLDTLQSSTSNGIAYVSWLPNGATRQAIVIKPYHGPSGSGFVVAGRSLREIEKSNDVFLQLAIIAWISGFLALGLLCFRPRINLR